MCMLTTWVNLKYKPASKKRKKKKTQSETQHNTTNAHKTYPHVDIQKLEKCQHVPDWSKGCMLKTQESVLNARLWRRMELEMGNEGETHTQLKNIQE